MKHTIIFSFFILTKGFVGQNLVPNPSFELFSSCPDPTAGSAGQFILCLNWINPSLNWPAGSPDYFNQCTTGVLDVPLNYLGYQSARTGSAYCGIAVYSHSTSNFREYIEAELTTILSPGACYRFEMYISSPNRMQYISDEIQVYFSDTLITVNSNWNPLPFQPQSSNLSGNYPDTLNWKLVSFDYIARGGERYLTIGNYKGDQNTNKLLTYNIPQYYSDAAIYIEDVSLTLVSIGCLVNLTENQRSNGFNIYPNPFTDHLDISRDNSKTSEIQIMDLFGNIIVKEVFINSITISTHDINAGLYIYQLVNDNKILEMGKILKAD